MQTQVVSSPTLLQEVVDRILSSRRITRDDQRLLLLVGNSDDEERTLVNQVFDRLRKGLLRVVD